jgi:hypothetical protein
VDINVKEKNTVSIFRAEGTHVSEKHAIAISSPEDGESMIFRNVSIYRRAYTVPEPRRTASLN